MLTLSPPSLTSAASTISSSESGQDDQPISLEGLKPRNAGVILLESHGSDVLSPALSGNVCGCLVETSPIRADPLGQPRSAHQTKEMRPRVQALVQEKFAFADLHSHFHGGQNSFDSKRESLRARRTNSSRAPATTAGPSVTPSAMGSVRATKPVAAEPNPNSPPRSRIQRFFNRPPSLKRSPVSKPAEPVQSPTPPSPSRITYLVGKIFSPPHAVSSLGPFASKQSKNAHRSSLPTRIRPSHTAQPSVSLPAAQDVFPPSVAPKYSPPNHAAGGAYMAPPRSGRHSPAHHLTKQVPPCVAPQTHPHPHPYFSCERNLGKVQIPHPPFSFEKPPLYSGRPSTSSSRSEPDARPYTAPARPASPASRLPAVRPKARTEQEFDRVVHLDRSASERRADKRDRGGQRIGLTLGVVPGQPVVDDQRQRSATDGAYGSGYPKPSVTPSMLSKSTGQNSHARRGSNFSHPPFAFEPPVSPSLGHRQYSTQSSNSQARTQSPPVSYSQEPAPISKQSNKGYYLPSAPPPNLFDRRQARSPPILIHPSPPPPLPRAQPQGRGLPVWPSYSLPSSSRQYTARREEPLSTISSHASYDSTTHSNVNADATPARPISPVSYPIHYNSRTPSMSNDTPAHRFYAPPPLPIHSRAGSVVPSLTPSASASAMRARQAMGFSTRNGISRDQSVDGSALDDGDDIMAMKYRAFYDDLRQTLSGAQFAEFERCVRRFDSESIPLRGPRGLMTRVKTILDAALLSYEVDRVQANYQRQRARDLLNRFEELVSDDST